MARFTSISPTRFSVSNMSFETFEQAERFAQSIVTVTRPIEIRERRAMSAPVVIAVIKTR